MKSVAIAAIFALSAIAASPPKEKTEPAEIPLGNIDRSSVRVLTAKGDVGAQLSFLFRVKDAQQTRRTFFATRVDRVRIIDGAAVIAEAKLSGIVEHEGDRKNRGGLVLSFATAEEANRAAAALRPFLK